MDCPQCAEVGNGFQGGRSFHRNAEMANDEAKTQEGDSVCQGMQTKREERGGCA